MKKTFSSKKSAFSLIELSIVLIIIGLLIAGITGGASLIKNSELRSAMGEARGYAVAVNGFYSQYAYLPGDYPSGATSSAGIAGSVTNAGATTTATGGNGRIEYYAADVVSSASSTSVCGNTTGIAKCYSESVAAWSQLIATGSIDATTALTYLASTSIQVPGTNMPASKIKFAGWHFDYRTHVVATSGAAFNTAAPSTAGYAFVVNEGGVASPQNVVVLTGNTASSTAALTLVNGVNPIARAALTGPDALAIDIKIDDGKANTGKVRGVNALGTVGGTDTTVACFTVSETAVTDYIVTAPTTKVCALSFQVDVNS